MRKSDHLTAIIVRELSLLLAEPGFRARGNMLRRTLPDAEQFINVQKSTNSTDDVAVVTINLGTVVKPLRSAVGRDRPTRSISDCDWQDRIGRYIGGERWWTLGSEDEARIAAHEVFHHLNTTLFELLDRMSTIAGIGDALKKTQLINFSVEVLDYFKIGTQS